MSRPIDRRTAVAGGAIDIAHRKPDVVKTMTRSVYAEQLPAAKLIVPG